MYTITYKDYFDKVLGCWIGKTVAGTIGGPCEGRKEFFDYEFDKRSIENMMPNDDLDLQVLWLEVLEKKGIFFKTEHLADSFYNNCPYQPGEYAIFKKNYLRGIMPPVSGTFNNDYYVDGMGCPIRSEIWACISPGNPQLAVDFARKDGIMDHGNNSVDAEAFFAALQAEAFVQNDIRQLIESAIRVIPENCKVAELIRFVLELEKCGVSVETARQKIIGRFGHPDCTNLFQNTGIILIALLYGKGHFFDTSMIALNCGYDTDCTCATAGAILGIINGAEKLHNQYGLEDCGYILKVKANRESDRLFDLAKDTCRVGLTVANELNTMMDIQDKPDFVPVPQIRYNEDAEIEIEYISLPALGVNATCDVALIIKNNTESEITGVLKIALPQGLVCDMCEAELNVVSGEQKRILLQFRLENSLEILNETNIVEATFSYGSHCSKKRFGIAGAAVWKLYGPFWDNAVSLPHMNYWERYGEHIHAPSENEWADLVRDYHLNAVADIDKPYINEDIAANGCLDNAEVAMYDCGYVNTFTDKFNISDFIGYQGPCCVYMLRKMYCDEEKVVHLQVGYTAPFKLWLNGKLVTMANDCNWWTAENKHIRGIKLNKGVNYLLLKAVRKSTEANYSVVFNKAVMGEQYSNFGSFLF